MDLNDVEIIKEVAAAEQELLNELMRCYLTLYNRFEETGIYDFLLGGEASYMNGMELLNMALEYASDNELYEHCSYLLKLKKELQDHIDHGKEGEPRT